MYGNDSKPLLTLHYSSVLTHLLREEKNRLHTVVILLLPGDQLNMARKGRLPIPSSSCVEEAKRKSNAVAAQSSTSTSTHQNKNKQLIVEEAWLIQLETALALYSIQHDHSHSNHQLSYRTFCRSICPKLALPEATVKNVRPEWTLAQRLWHDLICVATPSLYRVLQVNDGNIPTIVLQRTDESVLPTKHRLPELRRLIQLANSNDNSQTEENNNQQFQLTSSAEAVKWMERAEMFLAAASETTTASSQNSTTTTTTSKMIHNKKQPPKEPVITKDMTLEQRVLARAQHKQLLLSEGSKDIAKFPSVDVLQAAGNALFTHACSQLRRRNRHLQTQPRNNNTKKKPSLLFCMNFKDVVGQIQPHGERYDRPQWTLILRKIQATAPSFLKLYDPQTNSKKKKHRVFSKTTTVWMDTRDFRTVGALLAGEAPPPAPETPSASPTTTTSKTQKTKQMNTMTKQSAVVTVSGHKRSSGSGSSSSATNDQAAADQQPVVVKTQKKRGYLASILNASATTATSTEGLETSKKPKKRAALLSTSSNKRLKQQHDDDSDNIDTNNNNNTLRINSDFILTDDDYHGGAAAGGVVLQPSLEFPRGLRRLFWKMNEGDRI